MPLQLSFLARFYRRAPGRDISLTAESPACGSSQQKGSYGAAVLPYVDLCRILVPASRVEAYILCLPGWLLVWRTQSACSAQFVL